MGEIDDARDVIYVQSPNLIVYINDQKFVIIKNAFSDGWLII